ncbi:MAG: bacteriohemerythrin [Myxococcales bacterium]
MQNPIAWQDSLSVGIETIDNQHKSLFQALSDLQKTAQTRGERQAIQRLFTFLAQYTVEHFRDEEALMRSWNYSRYEAHKAEHDLLVTRLSELWESWMAGECEIDDVVDFLAIWLSHHIAINDKHIGIEFREGGSRESPP